jgi:hypothetical protein
VQPKDKTQWKGANIKEKCELFLIVFLSDDDSLSAVDTFAVETCKEIRFHFCAISTIVKKKILIIAQQ